MPNMKEFVIDGERYHATSLRAAKLQHNEHLESLLEASKKMPMVIAGTIHAMLIFAVAGKWGYACLQPEPGTCVVSTTRISWGRKTRREAELDARRHLTQLEQNPSYLRPDDTDGRREYDSWAAWQARYREGRAKGMSDDAARDYASRRAT